MVEASQLNNVSRIRSDVGRKPGSSVIGNRRLRHFPATIRSRPDGDPLSLRPRLIRRPILTPKISVQGTRLLQDSAWWKFVFGKNGTTDSAPREGFVKRLRSRLNRGDSWLTYDLANLAPGGKIDEDILEELETALIMADVGIDATAQIIADLEKRLAREELKDVDALVKSLRSALTGILEPVEQPLVITKQDTPFVILMVGVNGAGKTTTIGKLAKQLKDHDFSVMLAAGDTFRAAAIEQLQAWGDRNDVSVIAQQSGADPAAVIFDAWEAARSRKIDVLIADTAGRLQTQQGLMDELAKIKRVVGRQDPAAPHEIMLVLDASQGQNAMVQAERFNETLGLTGITVTKLDGSAKGGILLAIAEKLAVPVRFIGIGEGVDDMQAFRAAEYVDALLPDAAESQEHRL